MVTDCSCFPKQKKIVVRFCSNGQIVGSFNPRFKHLRSTVGKKSKDRGVIWRDIFVFLLVSCRH